MTQAELDEAYSYWWSNILTNEEVEKYRDGRGLLMGIEIEKIYLNVHGLNKKDITE